MTAEQIKNRLRSLDDYEMSLNLNSWDDPDRITDELIKVLNTRTKLKAMLKEALE